MKKIDTLIRLHKFELDEKRRALQELETHMMRIIEARQRLDQELIEEQNTASQALELGMTYAGYAQKFIERRAKLEEDIANMRVEVEKAEIIVQMAFQELKKFEITAERQAAAEKYESDRREQSELDEAGINRHHRKNKD